MGEHKHKRIRDPAEEPEEVIMEPTVSVPATPAAGSTKLETFQEKFLKEVQARDPQAKIIDLPSNGGIMALAILANGRIALYFGSWGTNTRRITVDLTDAKRIHDEIDIILGGVNAADTTGVTCVS